MTIVRTVLALLMGLSGLLACGPAPVIVDWNELDPGERGYIVILHGNEVLYVHGPYSRTEGQSEVVHVLQQEGIEIFFVALEYEAITSTVLAFDPTRNPTFETSSDSCSGRLLRKGSTLVPLRRTTSRALRFADDGFEEIEIEQLPLSLSVPTDHESCFPRPAPRFEAFGADPRWLSPGSESAPGVSLDRERHRVFFWSSPVAEDRVVVMNEAFVAVLDRGQSWQPDPARVWTAYSWPKRDEAASSWRLVDAVLDSARSSRDEVYLVVVLSSGTIENAVSSSEVLELIWRPDGFQTPRHLLNSRRFLERVQLVPPDQLFAAGKAGTLYFGPRGGPLSPVPWDGPVAADLWDSAPGPSGDDELVILGSNSALYFGRPDGLGGFRAEIPTDSRMGARQLVMLEATPDQRSYVVDSQGSDLAVRRPDTALADLTLELSSALESCVEPDACGGVALIEDRIWLGVSPDQTLLLAITGCAKIVEVDIERGCARPLPLEGGGWPRLDVPVSSHFAESRDAVYFGAGDGLLLEARWGR